MKTLFYINNILISCLLILLLGASLNIDLLFWCVIGLIPLGIYQSLTGLILLVKDIRNLGIQIYVAALIIVVAAMFLQITWLWMIPAIPMALYFTFLLRINQPKRV